MLKQCVIIIIILLLSSPLFSQEKPDLPADQKPDTTRGMQQQYDDYLAEEAIKDSMPAFSYFVFTDTLLYNLSLFNENLKDKIARSIYHDPADYLKFNQSNLVVHYRFTPIRNVSAPFNLPGNRTNVIFNNNRLDPIDHQLEPDGRIDYNDIPTETISDVYNIDGPTGLIFGGANATSSLILVPHRPDTTRAESQMIADVGHYGYSYTKARFAHRNKKGRSLKIGIGHRKTNNDISNGNDGNLDDADHQWAELILPLKQKIRAAFEFRMYNRDGFLPSRLDSLQALVIRSRRDRDLSSALEFGHSANSRSSIKYQMKTSGLNYHISGATYNHNIDMTEHIGVFSTEGVRAGLDYQINISGTRERYQEYSVDNKRHRGFGEIKLIKSAGSKSLLMMAKLERVGDFELGPTGMIQFNYAKSSFKTKVSVGYATKFPRQYELDLKAAEVNLYSDTTGIDYLEVGNSALQPEKQITANLGIGIGNVGNDLSLSVTGGMISDGIDWSRRDSSGYSYGVFQPVNRDIDFATATLSQNLSWGDKLLWTGGASYHYLDVKDESEPAYAPDYQLFSSVQLYYYWEKLDLHLYAYGEGFYNGNYSGYDGSKLGEEFVANVKLSFRIKKFRFYYIYQNPLDNNYTERESFTIPGRFNYYGVTWDFID